MPCDSTNLTSCHIANLSSSLTPSGLLEDFINASTSVAASTVLRNLTTAFDATAATATLSPTVSPDTLNTTPLFPITNVTLNTTSFLPFTNLSADTTTPFLPFARDANLSAAPSSFFSVSTTPNVTPLLLREEPVRLDTREVVVTLCLSLLAMAANLMALFLTRFTGGGQSPTMVFVRMLCLSDFFLACYGLGKMLMFLHADGLLVNFFLPESLLFTATTSSCLSLLLLNLDRGVKMAWPLWYLQHVDKPSIITGSVFLWNVSFILGFLPLLGWNSHESAFLYDLFRFYAWPYLLLMGLVWLACISGSLAVLVWVRGRFDLALGQQGGPLSRHLAEVEKYCKLRGTIALDLATWALCYLPFLTFLALACRSCPLGGRADLRVGVYHFVPVFMLRSLGGAGLQLYRTVCVQGLRKKRGDHGDSSATASHQRHQHHPHHHHHHHHHQQHHHPHQQRRGWGWGFFSHKRLSEEENGGVSTISYSNPLCDNSNSSASELVHLENTLTSSSSSTSLPQPPGLVDACSTAVVVRQQQQQQEEEEEEGEGSQGGISNPAYRPSIHFDVVGQGLCGVTEEITAL